LTHRIIFHITTKTIWNQFSELDFYEAPSYKTEGFIHASTAKQLSTTASRYYSKEKSILILHIDTQKLLADLKYEFSNSINEYFPHIYSPINKKSIIKIQEAENDNGIFQIRLTA
jgi:uncharacterized protein (DUF952 family)